MPTNVYTNLCLYDKKKFIKCKYFKNVNTNTHMCVCVRAHTHVCMRARAPRIFVFGNKENNSCFKMNG